MPPSTQLPAATAGPVSVGQLVDALERAFPPESAQDWDTGIGLTCGDRVDPVDRVLLAVDADDATVSEAEELGVQLLVTHHPLLFRAVQSVAAGPGTGGLVHRLQRAGIAHFAAHTNADAAAGGVNDALAELLGLTGLRPIVPDSADPGVGSGRIGSLPAPMTLRGFAELVAQAVPPTVTGVRVSGTADRRVRSVAVCGGSGGSFLTVALEAGADVYLTSDLTHHVAAELPRASDGSPQPALVDVAHWAAEWPVMARFAAVIGEVGAGTVSTTISTRCTDPWVFRVESPGSGAA